MNRITLIIARCLMLLVLLCLAIVPLAAGITMLPTIAIQTITVMLLFGFWSLACVLLGAWVQHRRHMRQSPIPDLADPQSIINFIKGKKPDDDDEPREMQDLASPPGFDL